MKRAGFLLVALAALAATAAAERPEKSEARAFHLKWGDLGRYIRGHRIGVELPSGIKLQGDPIAVESDQLVLDVRKTSNKRAYPKGRAIVPRPEVTRCRVFAKKSHTWRIVGAAIGGGIGSVAAAGIAQLGGRNAAGAAALAVAVPAGLGYLIGWAGDKGDDTIIIIEQ